MTPWVAIKLVWNLWMVKRTLQRLRPGIPTLSGRTLLRLLRRKA
jgi:hypothetical protein